MPPDGGHEELGRHRHVHRGAAGEDGHQEVRPGGVDAQGVGPRGHAAAAAAGARPQQGLHLDEQRPPALQDRHDHAAGHARHAVPEHERAGVRDGAQPVVAHLEDADLARRPEAVLDRGQDPQRVVAVPVEGEHRVDEVLHGAGAGQVAVLGHVPHQEQRDAARLRHAGEALHAGAHLGQAARRLGQLGIGDGLQRVDHHEGRAVALDGRLDRLDVGALEGEEVVRHRAHARRPPAHLGQRLLGRGDMTSTPVAATDESTWNSSVDLPMPGGPNSSVTEPPTTPPPMTRSSSLTPVRQRARPVGRDVAQRDGGRALRLPARPGRCTRTDAGPRVFHSPQAPHRPTQRSDVVPQAVQT